MIWLCSGNSQALVFLHACRNPVRLEKAELRSKQVCPAHCRASRALVAGLSQAARKLKHAVSMLTRNTSGMPQTRAPFFTF